jgi:hypothetical protein
MNCVARIFIDGLRQGTALAVPKPEDSSAASAAEVPLPLVAQALLPVLLRSILSRKHYPSSARNVSPEETPTR